MAWLCPDRTNCRTPHLLTAVAEEVVAEVIAAAGTVAADQFQRWRFHSSCGSSHTSCGSFRHAETSIIAPVALASGTVTALNRAESGRRQVFIEHPTVTVLLPPLDQNFSTVCHMMRFSKTRCINHHDVWFLSDIDETMNEDDTAVELEPQKKYWWQFWKHVQIYNQLEYQPPENVQVFPL